MKRQCQAKECPNPRRYAMPYDLQGIPFLLEVCDKHAWQLTVIKWKPKEPQ